MPVVISSTARESYPCASMIGEKKNGSCRECQTNTRRAANATANTASHHQSRRGLGFGAVFGERASDWFVRFFLFDMGFGVDWTYCHPHGKIRVMPVCLASSRTAKSIFKGSYRSEVDCE